MSATASTSGEEWEKLPSAEELMAKCLQLGLVMRQAPTYAITHPAVTLRPLPIKAETVHQLYEHQVLWNEAINRTARNYIFLRDAMQSTAQSDQAFTGRLVAILEKVYMTAPAGTDAPVYQPLMLGIFRSDYMRTVDGTSDADAGETAAQWKNIEINTISCSFAGLAPLVQEFHRYLERFREAEVNGGAVAAPRCCAARDATSGTYEAHNSATQVPAALARTVSVWRESVPLVVFLRQYAQRTGVSLQPVVLVIVQENERNTADQYALLLELLERHGIRSLRRTLTELHESLQLEHVTYGDHSHERRAEARLALRHQPLEPPFAVIEGKFVVAVAYFRSTYVPQDFPSEAAWETRERIEESNAVKCPSIPYHLMTFKKMQQLMSNVSEVLTPLCFAGNKRKATALAQHFVPQYSLNKEDYGRSAESHPPNEQGDTVDDPEYWIVDAVRHPDRYVLKPQLEGGGNLVAGEAMRHLLRDTKSSDPLYQRIRREYILMRKIHFPVVTGVLFRGGEVHVLRDNACSELGIYGVTLSAGPSVYILNEAAGSMVRTKPADVEDGGVMAGVAALDSLQLVGPTPRVGYWNCCGVLAFASRPWRWGGPVGGTAAVAVAATTAALAGWLMMKRHTNL